ncbi:hypothetical protein GJ496_009333 [Pomphorhynchus laevis]|nr:hypothetical protein GJ496_009333 [Pomphorhynchus laevis]
MKVEEVKTFIDDKSEACEGMDESRKMNPISKRKFFTYKTEDVHVDLDNVKNDAKARSSNSASHCLSFPIITYDMFHNGLSNELALCVLVRNGFIPNRVSSNAMLDSQSHPPQQCGNSIAVTITHHIKHQLSILHAEINGLAYKSYCSQNRLMILYSNVVWSAFRRH